MKIYRQDSHIFSLVAWTVICAAAAGVLFYHAPHIVSRSLRWTEYVGGAALLLLGPVSFLVYLLRARWIWVRVDPQKGIVVSDRYTIPWNAIQRIERKRPRFRKKSGPAEPGKAGDVGGGCVDVGGCGLDAGGVGAAALAVVLLLAAVLILWWLIVVVLIPLLVVPLLEVFAPFGDRIKIVGGKKTIVLRDLRGADEFLTEIGDRATISSDR